MDVKGVDISYCQEGIDYNKLKTGGVKFALIRAGYSEAVDRLLDTHVKGCETAGIDHGYYWFSKAKTIEAAKREAAVCLKAIGKYNAPKYPIFFDGEDNSIALSVGKTVMTDIALAFITAIEADGYPAGLYVNPDWMETKYDKSRLVGKVDIWLAHWTWSPDKKSNYNYGQLAWQWGIEKYGGLDTDADLCFIDYPAKTAKWYAAHNPQENTTKSVEELAIEVLNGAWGNGVDRKQRLINAGYDYNAVQAEVNRMLSAEAQAAKKTVAELAIEVLRGLWGDGEDRKHRLTAAGYDYAAVQAEVNRLLK